MYSVASIERIPMADEIGFVIASPVECRRTIEACKGAFGEIVSIDGEEYIIKSFGFFMPAFPISIGENILVLVQRKYLHNDS